MTLRRFIRGILSLSRIPEIFRCVRYGNCPIARILAYLQIKQPQYPFDFFLSDNKVVRLVEWADMATAWVILWGKEYRFLSSDRKIIDAGANIGLFSLGAYVNCPDAQIVSLEPFPSSYDRLLDCIEDNNLEHRVFPVCKALVGLCTGSAIMDASNEIDSSSRKVLDGPVPPDQSIQVEAVTLNELLELLGWNDVDFLKMDIEGSEYEVIKQTSLPVLRRFKRISIEYHESGKKDELFSKLLLAGFVLWSETLKGKAGIAEFVRS